MLQRAGKWEVRHYYLVYPALHGLGGAAWLVGWLRRDYGICFHSGFHGFTYIRQYISYYLNTFTSTALQTQAKGSVP